MGDLEKVIRERDETIRLLADALQDIADRYIPSIPAAWASGANDDEYVWAARHVGRLRGTAFDALIAAGIIKKAPAPGPLDRAWRAVDALGGTHGDTDFERGYAAALDAACTAIEKLGGTDFETSRAVLRTTLMGKTA